MPCILRSLTFATMCRPLLHSIASTCDRAKEKERTRTREVGDRGEGQRRNEVGMKRRKKKAEIQIASRRNKSEFQGYNLRTSVSIRRFPALGDDIFIVY